MCAKFWPRILMEDQMESRKVNASEIFEQSTQEAEFLLKVVTGDESWICADDPETKCQSSVGTPRHHRKEKRRKPQNLSRGAC
jgi:hypothetical protein